MSTAQVHLRAITKRQDQISQVQFLKNVTFLWDNWRRKSKVKRETKQHQFPTHRGGPNTKGHSISDRSDGDRDPSLFECSSNLVRYGQLFLFRTQVLPCFYHHKHVIHTYTWKTDKWRDDEKLKYVCSCFFNPFTAQACIISGLKCPHTCLQTVYFPVLCLTNLFLILFWHKSFQMVKREWKKTYGFHILHYYRSFSNDIVTVKGLITYCLRF